MVSKIEGIRFFSERAKDIAKACCREAMLQISPTRISRRNIRFSLLQSEEIRPGGPLLLEQDIREIADEFGLSSVSVQSYPHGNAAGMNAIWDGQRQLEEDPNSLQIILGLDSLLQLQTLAYLEKANRLKSASCKRGLIPGEACACVILENSAVFPKMRDQEYCTLVNTYSTEENAPMASDEPCLGQGLTDAIFGALEAVNWSSDAIIQVYCDLNGEVYRAHEWMLAHCRTLNDPIVSHPADCIGDIGAAFCPLLICWAAIAFERGYAKSDNALIFCSSDGGLRGAICLERTTS